MNLRRVIALSIALLLITVVEVSSFSGKIAEKTSEKTGEDSREIFAENFSEIAVIVNSKNHVSSISSKDLENIYKLKKTTWPTGEKIEAINLVKQHFIRKKFSDIILNKNSSQMDKFYLKQALSGKGQPPRVLSFSGDVKDFVRYHKNAIGYIDKKDLDDSVKILFIEGLNN